MEKKTKIIIGVGVGLVAAVGAYFLITKGMKPKEEEETDDKAPDLIPKDTETKVGPIVIKKDAPKSKGFDAPKPTTNITAPKPTAKPAGKKTWVYAKYDNTKVYKKGTQRGVAIGGLYNTYNKGNIIGNMVGSTSVGGAKHLLIMDAKNPVIVSEKLVYTKTI